jgi:hypothetical protein
MGAMAAAAVVAVQPFYLVRSLWVEMEHLDKAPTAEVETLVVHLYLQIFDAAAAVVALLLPEIRQAEAVQRSTAAAVVPAPHIPSAVHL